jgi:hypothetical protein
VAAANPDPSTPLTSITGRTRALDDWMTIFHLCLFAFPSWPEAAEYVPVAEKILATFTESDARCALLVTGTEEQTRRILGPLADKYLTFCDPMRVGVQGLKLEKLPAFVHLRADTALAEKAEGWDPARWQAVADSIAKATHWTRPLVSMVPAPAPFAGWDVTGSAGRG